MHKETQGRGWSAFNFTLLPCRMCNVNVYCESTYERHIDTLLIPLLTILSQAILKFPIKVLNKYDVLLAL